MQGRVSVPALLSTCYRVPATLAIAFFSSAISAERNAFSFLAVTPANYFSAPNVLRNL